MYCFLYHSLIFFTVSFLHSLLKWLTSFYCIKNHEVKWDNAYSHNSINNLVNLTLLCWNSFPYCRREMQKLYKCGSSSWERYVCHFSLWTLGTIKILHDVLNRVSLRSLPKALRLMSVLLFCTCCLEVQSLLIMLDFFNLSASRTPSSFSFMQKYEHVNTISFSQQAAPASLAQLFLSVIDRCLIQTKDPSDAMIVNHDDDDTGWLLSVIQLILPWPWQSWGLNQEWEIITFRLYISGDETHVSV